MYDIALGVQSNSRAIAESVAPALYRSSIRGQADCGIRPLFFGESGSLPVSTFIMSLGCQSEFCVIPIGARAQSHASEHTPGDDGALVRAFSWRTMFVCEDQYR
jgi:hypothetical protein